jgi:phospholipase/carboxylesterase
MNAAEIGSIQEPHVQAKACIIWMHGLGAESMDMEMLAHSLPLSDLPLRHVFLNAPIRPVTLNNGIEMRAWYDIPSDFSRQNEDQKGILASEKSIKTIIDDQIAQGIPANAIGLAGFSQGGAMALHTALHYSQPLAGVIALSGYLPLSDTHNASLPRHQQKTPFFIGAGLHDTIVHYEWTKASETFLTQAGFSPIDFHAYPMEHCVCMDEMRDLSAWIRKYFNF